MAVQRFLRRGRRRRGGRVSSALAGLAAGAGFAYFLDSRRGAGRRSQVVQRAGRVAREMEATVEAGARDLSARARGLAHEARARIESARAPDDVVVERIRARLGRLTAHAHAIRVASREGRVELTGPVLRTEHARVVRGIRMVRGVLDVEDHLEPHDASEGVSRLQGSPAQPGPLHEPPHGYRSPGLLLIAGVSGAYLVLRALLGRGLARIPAGFVGAALIARVLSESEPGRREARRIAARLAGKRAARAREGRLEAEAHEGAWHPEAETRGPARPAGGDGASMLRVTRDIVDVRRWAELRGGRPCRNAAGEITLAFEGEPCDFVIGWDEFEPTFCAGHCVFVYDEAPGSHRFFVGAQEDADRFIGATGGGARAPAPA